MAVINVIKPFKYAHGGFNVVEYPLGVQSVPDEVYSWCLQTGFGIPEQQDDQKKMRTPVTENKDLGTVPKRKPGRPKGSGSRKRTKLKANGGEPPTVSV